jgi:hypothetical protein
MTEYDCVEEVGAAVAKNMMDNKLCIKDPMKKVVTLQIYSVYHT